MTPRKPIKRSVQTADDISRSMPFSLDAEKGVLSCFLHNPVELLTDAASTIAVESFYHHSCRSLYEVMLLFREKGWPVEFIALSQYIQDKGMMDKIGGPGTLAELLDFTPAPTHYGHYKGILRDKYLLRRIIGACTESINDAYAYQEDVPGLLNKVEGRFSDVANETNSLIHAKTWREKVDDFEQEWNNRYLKKKQSAIRSRWPEWDSHFGGIRPEFHIIKGKTSQGKTSLALNMLSTVGVIRQKPCLWFPYEMSEHSLICRLIADIAEVDSRCVFSPDVFPPTPAEMTKIASAKERIADSPIEIVKQANMDATFLVAKCLAFASKHGEVGLVGVDYLQRIPHPDWGGRNDNTSDRLTYNCGQCFNVQQEMKCAMLVISSTNQDGGTLGSQSADYDTDIAIEVDKEKGFRVPKNRNGPTAKDWIPLHFNGRYVRFESKHENEPGMPP